jgi:hypothetical protein
MATCWTSHQFAQSASLLICFIADRSPHDILVSDQERLQTWPFEGTIGMCKQ